MRLIVSCFARGGRRNSGLLRPRWMDDQTREENNALYKHSGSVGAQRGWLKGD